MPEPALTIACLIRDPTLAEVCGRWLSDGRYLVERFDPVTDPVVILDRRREDFDAVLLETGSYPSETYRTLNDLGLLLPAVVIGEVTGQVAYHDAEVHLPPDQLEQLGYSLDAALSRFVRRGLLSQPQQALGHHYLPERLRRALRGHPDPGHVVCRRLQAPGRRGQQLCRRL